MSGPPLKTALKRKLPGSFDSKLPQENWHGRGSTVITSLPCVTHPTIDGTIGYPPLVPAEATTVHGSDGLTLDAAILHPLHMSSCAECHRFRHMDSYAAIQQMPRLVTMDRFHHKHPASHKRPVCQQHLIMLPSLKHSPPIVVYDDFCGLGLGLVGNDCDAKVCMSLKSHFPSASACGSDPEDDMEEVEEVDDMEEVD